jgi:hypothetical protein
MFKLKFRNILYTIGNRLFLKMISFPKLMNYNLMSTRHPITTSRDKSIKIYSIQNNITAQQDLFGIQYKCVK